MRTIPGLKPTSNSARNSHPSVVSMANPGSGSIKRSTSPQWMPGAYIFQFLGGKVRFFKGYQRIGILAWNIRMLNGFNNLGRDLLSVVTPVGLQNVNQCKWMVDYNVLEQG